MATIENKPYVRDQPPPAVDQQVAIPLDVTPVVTNLIKANVVENDQSLVAATGDPTLRPLADYLAMIFAMAGTSRQWMTGAGVFVTVGG